MVYLKYFYYWIAFNLMILTLIQVFFKSQFNFSSLKL
jgi:hypothetical protein